MKKKIMICIDLEGYLGMPFRTTYDIVKITRRILEALKKHEIKAVFFVVGKLIEEYPDLIKEISEHGHEIGIHGYEHQHLDRFTELELSKFSDNIFQVENLLEKLIGKRPKWFRSPYLMNPIYYTPELYQVLESHGYKWVSNRKILSPEEFFRPNHFFLPATWWRNDTISSIFLILLNMRMILSDSVTEKKGLSGIIANAKWLYKRMGPFNRDNIVEFPIFSPLDCDLLGLPKPEENTPDNIIRYAVEALTEGAKKRGDFYSITFHDWIIGPANRMQILEKILETFSKNDNIVFISSPKT